MASALIALVLALTAQTPIIDQATTRPRGRTVYVHPATAVLTEAEARRLEPRIDRVSRGPLYVAILPAAARQEVDGTTLGVALELSRRIITTNPPAVHAVLIEDEFRAVNRDVDADRLARKSLRRRREAGLAAVLLDFARRVGDARARAAATPYAPLERPTEDASGDLWIVAILAACAAAGTAILVRRRHAR